MFLHSSDGVTSYRSKCIIRFQALLRKKAADELKKEQERKAEQRKKTINDRCGQPKSVDSANEGRYTLRTVKSQ